MKATRVKQLAVSYRPCPGCGSRIKPNNWERHKGRCPKRLPIVTVSRAIPVRDHSPVLVVEEGRIQSFSAAVEPGAPGRSRNREAAAVSAGASRESNPSGADSPEALAKRVEELVRHTGDVARWLKDRLTPEQFAELCVTIQRAFEPLFTSKGTAVRSGGQTQEFDERRRPRRSLGPGTKGVTAISQPQLDRSLPAFVVAQPFATRIVTGKMRFVYRSQTTNRRGRVPVFASGTTDRDALTRRERDAGFPSGTVVGDVEIVDSAWDPAESKYRWRLANPRCLATSIVPPRAAASAWFKPWG